MKKNMVKILAFVLVAVMLMTTATTAFAAGKSAKSSMITGMDYSATEWMSDEMNQIMFVVLMIAENVNTTFTQAETQIVSEAIVSDAVYITKDGLNITVFAFGKNQTMLFMYGTGAGIAQYDVIDIQGGNNLSKLLMDQMVSQGTIPSYEKIDCELLMSVISNIVNSDK